MNYMRSIVLVVCCAMLFGSWAKSFQPSAAAIGEENEAPAAAGNWYFAVSGDSRDCGDVIMPRIAQSIADDRKKTPVEFYWHLGDLRAIYRVDCDMAKRKNPQTKCAWEGSPGHKDLEKNDRYVASAWFDYIANEIRPFEKAGVPFVLGIGNHEVIPPKSRIEFQQEFKEWLTQKSIQQQRQLDRTKNIPSKDGDTYFHFVRNKVDFIYLDNSDPGDKDSAVPDPSRGFSLEQLKWLEQVLQADLAEPSVKTIIVGMHAALPYSKSRDHAMDNTCSSFCSGVKAYDLLAKVRSQGKNIYVFASHSHYFEEDIYNSTEHQGNVIPGWIIGTAGAEQYRQQIRYGYLLVRVEPNGTIVTSFKDVGRNTSSVVPEESPQLLDYCFERNREDEKTTQQKKNIPNNVKDQHFCKCK